MHVLFVKLTSLGDVIHALPALTDAEAAIPGIRFDWVVDEALAPVARWHPAVDTIIPSLGAFTAGLPSPCAPWQAAHTA
jgi:heptosyltransferase-1